MKFTEVPATGFVLGYHIKNDKEEYLADPSMWSDQDSPLWTADKDWAKSYAANLAVFNDARYYGGKVYAVIVEP